MTPQEYLEFTRTTAARQTSSISDWDWARYVRLGLISEIGEVAGQVKRFIRDDGGVLTDERREKLLDELGDVLWYWAQWSDGMGEYMTAGWPVYHHSYEQWSLDRCVTAATIMGTEILEDPRYFVVEQAAIIATMLGSSLEEVVDRNVAKLQGRVAAGTIHGEGDDR